MKKFLLFCLFLFAAGQTVFAQAPSPTPLEDRDVVRINTNLIQIDVTVTDSRGRIVTDLKPEEIEVYENNIKQNITNFSFVNAETKTIEKQTPARKNAPPAPPVPVITAPLRSEEVRRTLALVVDDLSLSFTSAYTVRRALRKFVDEMMQPNDLVAIIRTGSGVGALQQFTSDKRQLHAAIERLKWHPGGNSGTTGVPPIESGIPNSIRPPSLIGKQPDEDVNEIQQYRKETFTVGTLGSVHYVIEGMRELPGRKSIILFSDGFSMQEENGLDSRVMTFLRRLVDLANRAAVVIYTMDARGLEDFNLTAADSVGNMTPQEIQRHLSARKNNFFSSQAGLEYLAEVTGGITIKNQNRLDDGIEKVLNDQKGYYLVGYEPDEKTFDPVSTRFNKLTVKVNRKGLKVRYRSGFFGITDADTRNLARSAPTTPREQILRALISPFATGELTVKLTPIFTNDVSHGSYISSLIHVKAADLKFTDEADGWKQTVFDVVAVALGEGGQLVDSVSRTETVRVNGATFEKILREGFVYTVPFPIKRPGAYQLRIALRDAGTARIGSANQFIEVPDLRKARLTLGGIILQNVDDEKSNRDDSAAPDASSADYIQDTAERKFKSGSALFYNTVIFNPKLSSANIPNLKTQVKIFQDQKEYLPVTSAIMFGKKPPT